MSRKSGAGHMKVRAHTRGKGARLGRPKAGAPSAHMLHGELKGHFAQSRALEVADVLRVLDTALDQGLGPGPALLLNSHRTLEKTAPISLYVNRYSGLNCASQNRCKS